jgi:fused signal recognition particle receptor
MDVWGRLRQGLAKTQARLGESLSGILGRRGAVDPAMVESLEEALLAADVGPATTEKLIAGAREKMKRQDLSLREALEKTAAELLSARRASFEPGPERPWVAMMVGVNGSGKTTLAGKLAGRFASSGRSTLMVAADTFRAAAAEQLEAWAERAGASIVRAKDGGDPGAVVHDGLAAAKARGAEIVLVDTAGRLHTKQNLMAELQKVVRVCQRQIEGAPHHTMLVLDATTGQNALVQAREFHRAVPITSLAINKLDGTARGGAVLSIAVELELPISVIGVGEGVDDWAPFDPEAFARGLFG